MNVIDRSPRELLETLDFNQAAPPGFLLLERGMTFLFGYSELALRAIPLLSGIAAIIIFAWLAKRLLAPFPALLAVLLFSVADGLIYYSSEAKPYSLDVLATLLLLAGVVFVGESAPTRGVAILFGILGVLLMSVSYAALIVVGSVAGVFLLVALHERRVMNIVRSIPLLMWSVCAIAVGIYGWSRSDGIRLSFEAGEGSDSAFEWFGSLIHEVNVLGTGLLTSIGFPDESPWNHLFKVAAVCFVTGTVSLARSEWRRLLLLLAPMVFTLFAWSLGQYPLVPRTTLFLVPVVILLLAQGVDTIVRWTPSPWRPFGAFVAAGILVGPLWTMSEAVTEPRVKEEIKPVLAYIQARSAPGDTLYVHYGAQYALVYYELCRCTEDRAQLNARWSFKGRAGHKQFAPALTGLSPNILVSPYADGDLDRQLADLQRLPDGKRIWFLYTHVAGAAEEMFIRHRLIARLEEIGERIGGIDRPGAHAYLYET